MTGSSSLSILILLVFTYSDCRFAYRLSGRKFANTSSPSSQALSYLFQMSNCYLVSDLGGSGCGVCIFIIGILIQR